MAKVFAWLWPRPKKTEQPSSPEFDTPWRSVDWKNDGEKILMAIKHFQPGNPEVKTLRILLHGPVGAGKSSFIKSADNALRGHITNRAQAHSALTGRSFTVKSTIYKVKKDGPGSYFPFTFTDIAGIQAEGGISTEDIIKLLNGHINSGYTFNPLSAITENDPNYNKTPSLKDKIHCLVAVLPAHTVSMMNDKVFQEMKVVREKARDLGIPEVIIMTKVDEACELVKGDLEKVYTSKLIKQKMEECSVKLGVTEDCIYPVKNYHKEHDTDASVDFLILDALNKMITFANDHLEDKLDEYSE